MNNEQAENIRKLVIEVMARAEVRGEINKQEATAINQYLGECEASLQHCNKIYAGVRNLK
jgi:hypothetical protein